MPYLKQAFYYNIMLFLSKIPEWVILYLLLPGIGFILGLIVTGVVQRIRYFRKLEKARKYVLFWIDDIVMRTRNLIDTLNKFNEKLVNFDNDDVILAYNMIFPDYLMEFDKELISESLVFNATGDFKTNHLHLTNLLGRLIYIKEMMENLKKKYDKFSDTLLEKVNEMENLHLEINNKVVNHSVRDNTQLYDEILNPLNKLIKDFSAKNNPEKKFKSVQRKIVWDGLINPIYRHCQTLNSTNQDVLQWSSEVREICKKIGNCMQIIKSLRNQNSGQFKNLEEGFKKLETALTTYRNHFEQTPLRRWWIIWK
ncbi:MAG: hypothetical protein ACHQNT_08900 [Bacteroidia bacterium]